MTKYRFNLFLSLSLLFSLPTTACTIVSAVAENGHVWNMNNEDGPPDVANFISVFPSTEANRYGYYTPSYLTPRAGEGGGTQGGMNEAGLTFDFNAMRYVDDFDPSSRKAYPDGNDAILAHILGNMRSVEEVVAFFETYWFEDGFRSAQMHVADRDGKFAIISAAGVYVAEPGEPLVSTNFDIRGGEDGGGCWRYPIATERLAEREVGLASMLSIALDTRQKEYLTVYSNVQNLTTGDIWFMSYHDADELVQINIQELLARGRTTYTFTDLEALRGGHQTTPDRSSVATADTSLATEAIAGTYQNNYTGDMVVTPRATGLAVAFANGTQDEFEFRPDGTYVMEAEGMSVIAVTFQPDEDTGIMNMRLFLDGWWAATGWRAAE